VVVTRQAEDAPALQQLLQALGAHVAVVPCIAVVPLPVHAALCEALHGVLQATHVAFASRQGVRSLAAALTTCGLALPAGAALVAVGPATAESIQQAFGRAAAVVEPHTAEGMADWLVARCVPGTDQVVLPGARGGRTHVADTLVAHNVPVLPLLLYETRAHAGAGMPVVLPERVDYVLFTSPSTVRGWMAQTPWPEGARAISMGPSTSAALVQAGLPVARQAAVQTLDGLVAATVELEHL
jgi:uroporphyrinogen III methyltransferase/synthase